MPSDPYKLEYVAAFRDDRLTPGPVNHQEDPDLEGRVAELMTRLTPLQAQVVQMRADGHRWVDIERTIYGEGCKPKHADDTFKRAVRRLRGGAAAPRHKRSPEDLRTIASALGVPATALPDGSPMHKRDRPALRAAVQMLRRARFSTDEIATTIGVSPMSVFNLDTENKQIKLGTFRSKRAAQGRVGWKSNGLK